MLASVGGRVFQKSRDPCIFPDWEEPELDDVSFGDVAFANALAPGLVSGFGRAAGG